MQKMHVAVHKPVILCLLFFFSAKHLLSQPLSITGSTNVLNTIVGTAVIVDDDISVTATIPINQVNVLVAGNYNYGDKLTVDNAALPPGAVAYFDAIRGKLTITATTDAAGWQNILRTVSFSTSSYTSGTRNVVFTVGTAVYNYQTGHYYEKISSGMSWTSAKTMAEARSYLGAGGYLATITSRQENDFIWTILQGGDGWIGSSDDYMVINAAKEVTAYANQTESEGKWHWVCGPEKGEQFSDRSSPTAANTFVNWYSGQPDNWASRENYGEIFYNNNGFWNDLPNTILLGSVVEYGGLTTDPPLHTAYSRSIMVAQPIISGDGATPGNFTNNNNRYLVDGTIRFSNIHTITDVSARISQSIQTGDSLDYNPYFLPAGITANYNAITGILQFSGTATDSSWNQLLQTVSFKTTASDLSDRKIKFTPGNPGLDIAFTKKMAYLPVLLSTLLSFEIKKENKNVAIEWKTVNEKNGVYYQLERSSDNQHFEVLGHVNGQGNSNIPGEYHFTDAQPIRGIGYYRLKQMDADRNYSYSATKRISFETTPVNLLYPTVATDNIHIRLDAVANVVDCYIINAAGSIVRKLKPSGALFSINVSDLARGRYIARIVDKNGTQDNLTFIKE